MSLVWKFPLPHPVCTVSMPVDAQVLSVAEQDGELVVWALCSPDAPVHDRCFAAINTGAPAPTPGYGHFVGTVQTHSGIVWHVFEARS